MPLTNTLFVFFYLSVREPEKHDLKARRIAAPTLRSGVNANCMRQSGPMVMALALRSGDPGFKA